MSAKTILIKATITLILFSAAALSKADPLVSAAKIARVTNSRSAGDGTFVVLTSGGTGPCSTNWIGFPQTISGVTDSEMQKKAYAAAMMAMATGYKVNIVAAPGDTNCWAAFYIEVYP